MENKKHFTYPSNKNTQTQKSKEKSHHKEVLSIYKTQKDLHSIKSANFSGTETQSSITCPTCPENFINVQKLYSKHFQQIYVQNQNKDHLTIIDDFIQSKFQINQDYATSQTISTAEAFRYSSITQNLKRFYILNSSQRLQNLEHNLSLAIKKDLKVQDHHILVHYDQNFYNLFLKNLNKHKKLQQNVKNNRNTSQIEMDCMTGLQKNLKRSSSKQNKKINYPIIQRNYQKVLENINLSKYSMKDVSLTQENQTKKLIQLVHQLKKVFTNKNKQRKLKSHLKLKKQKQFRQNSSKSHKKFISSCKSSRNSILKNPSKITSQKQHPFLTQRSSPVKYTQNSNQNLYLNFQEQDSKIISSICLPENAKINSSPNKKIKKDMKQKQMINFEKLQKQQMRSKISRNDTENFVQNVYCLPSYGSKMSKTSTATPKVFSQYPSEINIQQKSIKNKFGLKENNFVKYQSPLSTPKIKFSNSSKLSANKNHKVKVNKKIVRNNQVSAKKDILEKDSKSKLSTTKQQKKQSNLNVKFTNHSSKSKDKIAKKLFFSSDKQNFDAKQNQYGIDNVKSKKISILVSQDCKFTQIQNQDMKRKSKQASIKLRQSSKSKDKLAFSQEKKNQTGLKVKRNSFVEMKNVQNKVNVKKLISGYATCDVSLSKRRTVLDEYLCG